MSQDYGAIGAALIRAKEAASESMRCRYVHTADLTISDVYPHPSVEHYRVYPGGRIELRPARQMPADWTPEDG